ncbi:hypothetical protein C0J52_26796 [Blattella germanica]|nr:hypothetical protein C0J52_26796 [Blattella germanica]
MSQHSDKRKYFPRGSKYLLPLADEVDVDAHETIAINAVNTANRTNCINTVCDSRAVYVHAVPVQTTSGSGSFMAFHGATAHATATGRRN